MFIGFPVYILKDIRKRETMRKKLLLSGKTKIKLSGLHKKGVCQGKVIEVERD